MKLLALDTSSDACSVALQCDERLIERHVVQAKEHTRLLIPMIDEVLAEGGVTTVELDAIVLGNGPGSFIGMRIAASVAQGLAYGANLGIVPVSSLAAVAAEAFHRSTATQDVVVAQDAHMNEVYLARFRRGEDGLPIARGETWLQPIERIGELAASGDRVHVAGFGWQRYPQLEQLNEDLIADLLDVQFPRAAFLLGRGAAAFRKDGTLPPDQLVPDYVRSKVASPASAG